ncbi:TorF family putative porin [Thalassotalea sp. ND16A]|uniref:TorF family putative porin n=1 Tax=Thalassotalea sp. ND16A TaxID=1535422 RepID=UPI0009DFEFBE|nr:TorF family putative porin [Thalassotalea sp. ND16A]
MRFFSWYYHDLIFNKIKRFQCSPVYAGLFSATNKFELTPDIRAVLAPYIGKFGSFGESDISYNVFVFHYTYPGVEGMDYTELWMEIIKDFGPVKLKFELTPTLNDWFGVEGWTGINYAVHPSKTFANGITVLGSIGYQELSGEGAEGWAHWNLGVNKDFYGLHIVLRYHDSDVDSSHKVYGSEQGRQIFDERFVFSVSKSF